MKASAIRFCAVSPQSAEQAAFFEQLGLPRKKIPEGILPPTEGYSGAIFTAGDSWVETWPVSREMPEGIMLQLVVDDADAFAEEARRNGLEPQGPLDAHGERIYFIEAPGGLQMSFQSPLE